ncbi:alpha/beta hydrolase [Streptomyces sp. NPDC052052]|uniref:alpha/beta fold hydrolase n=1 Tax=Streptomyces sp. NPDC052052 TaxID=3154756 RepID=UPI0034292856
MQPPTVTYDDSLDLYADVADGVRLCYRIDGGPEGVPLLLLSGLGQDLTYWPQAFVDSLVARGFRVIRHDNRDTGRSTTIDKPAPPAWRQLFGRPLPDAYTLADTASDSVGLLRHLGVRRVHLLGQSMGGMIAQVIAAEYPEQMHTLTSLYSTTGSKKAGKAAWSTKLKPAAKPPADAQEGLATHLKVVHHPAGPAYPVDEELEAAYVAGLWARATVIGGGGFARQVQAISASGDRTGRVRSITAPTLVIHGDHDLMVDPSGGLATAAAIRGSVYVPVAGMGHHLAPGVFGLIADLVGEHTGVGS